MMPFWVNLRNSTRRSRTRCSLLPSCWVDYGPQLGRPHADTLKGSKHANMKELRFEASDGASRVAFAFDPRRRAILLVAGDKSGGSPNRFYRQLIAKADRRFSAHLEKLSARKKET